MWNTFKAVPVKCRCVWRECVYPWTIKNNQIIAFWDGGFIHITIPYNSNRSVYINNVLLNTMAVINIEEAKMQVDRKGFLDVALDPALDLFAEIQRLKKDKNAVLLAHYYQDADIQDVADFIGDSLGLAQEAARTKADIIVFAGVHFMAETAKILNPDKKVLLPDLKAGCSLADSAPTERFRTFREKHPDHLVISYINCTAEVKALSDIICTSSNAEKIIESLPPEQKIIFAPDKNLGAYLIKKTGRNMLLWNGACIVHEIFSVKKITELKTSHHQAKFIAHPECEEPILRMADFIGSTTALLKYTQTNSAKEFIVGTESGIHPSDETFFSR